MSQQPPPSAASRRRPRALIFSLILVIVAASFAVGVGVTGLLAEDDPVTVRALRTSTDTGDVVTVAPAPVVSVDRDTRFGLLDEVYEILNREFVEPDAVDLVRLRVAAIDGVVEALERPDRRWALSVQWHPEREEAADQRPLFEAFVAACREAPAD